MLVYAKDAYFRPDRLFVTYRGGPNGKARLIDAKTRTRCPPRFRLVITACTRATRWLHFFFFSFSGKQKRLACMAFQDCSSLGNTPF